MVNQLAIENAADFVHKAFLHESPLLKSAAMNFILKNLCDVMNPEGWKELKKNSDSPNIFEEMLVFTTERTNI
jgi:hypothetical protein